MSERQVIAACMKSRQAWSVVAPALTESDFGEQAKMIFAAITEYYNNDAQAAACDTEIVTRMVTSSLTQPKHKEMFTNLCKELGALEVSPPNVALDMLAVKRTAAGERLASALAAGRDREDVKPLLDAYEQLMQAETLYVQGEEAEEDMQAAHIGNIIGAHYGENLIKVWPEVLNDKLDGGMLPGHHVVVFARPEAGKTLALLNMIAGFLNQNLKVMYFGNEDPLPDIAFRMVCRLTTRDKQSVLADPDGSHDLAMQRGYGNVVFVKGSPGTPAELESKIAKHKPQVVVIDQLRNLNNGNEAFVQKLEAVAMAARNIAKRHNVLVISATQAGASADGKAVLEMGDIDSSNTGIPATADVMIGIGGTEDDFARDRRIISLPKNKRSGRHEWFPVRIEPATSAMRGV